MKLPLSPLPYPLLTHSQQNSPAKRRHIEELWKSAYRAGIEQAAQLVELEYAADKKMQDRLKQIASHIRDLSK